VDWNQMSCVVYGPVEDSCECGNEMLDYIKGLRIFLLTVRLSASQYGLYPWTCEAVVTGMSLCITKNKKFWEKLIHLLSLHKSLV
jgi:hypothetical protein